MILLKLLFDHYLQQALKQEDKAKANPGKDVSVKNGTYGHPISESLACIIIPFTVELRMLFQFQTNTWILIELYFF